MRALSSHTAVAAARGTGVSKEFSPPPTQHWQLQADTDGPFGLIRPIPSFCLRVEETLPNAFAVPLTMLTGAAVGQTETHSPGEAIV